MFWRDNFQSKIILVKLLRVKTVYFDFRQNYKYYGKKFEGRVLGNKNIK